MSSQNLMWVVVPMVVSYLVIEFIAGFGGYLADKSTAERKDQSVLRRAAWKGTLMVLLVLGSWFGLYLVVGR